MLWWVMTIIVSYNHKNHKIPKYEIIIIQGTREMKFLFDEWATISSMEMWLFLRGGLHSSSLHRWKFYELAFKGVQLIKIISKFVVLFSINTVQHWYNFSNKLDFPFVYFLFLAYFPLFEVIDTNYPIIFPNSQFSPNFNQMHTSQNAPVVQNIPHNLFEVWRCCSYVIMNLR